MGFLLLLFVGWSSSTGELSHALKALKFRNRWKNHNGVFEGTPLYIFRALLFSQYGGCLYRTPTPLLFRAQSNLLAGAHSGPGTCCELVCTCSLLHHVPISSSLVVALAFTGRAGRVAPWLLCSSVVSCALLWYSYINPSAGINMFTSADSCVPACHLIWY